MVVPGYSLTPPASCYFQQRQGRTHYMMMGEGPPLVLLHGLGSCSLDWFMVTPGLASTHRLVLIDLRGHGQSSLAANGDYRIAAMSEDVASLVEHLELGPVDVLGLSLGGCVTLDLASRHSQILRKMVLVNGFARLRSRGLRTIRRRVSRLYAACRDVDHLAYTVASGLFSSEQAQRIAYERIRRNDLGVLRRSMLALARFDLIRQLPEIPTPALVLAGKRDQTVPFHCAQELALRLPRAKLRVVPDAGHALPYDQPQRFLDLVRSFLAEPDEEGIGADLHTFDNLAMETFVPKKQ